MKLFSLAAAIIAGFSMITADAAYSLEANKKIAKSFLDEIFNKHDPTAVDRYVGNYYNQHNPSVADGPQAIKDFAGNLTSNTKVEFGAIVAEGNLVWLDTRYTALPGLPTSIVVDVFRIQDGKVVEHWDIIQAEVTNTTSGHPMFPITSKVAKASPTTLQHNKKIAKALLHGLFNLKDASVVDKYIGPTYTQHNPSAPDGPSVLKDFVPSMTNDSSIDFGAIHATGDLVFCNVRYSGGGSSVTVGVEAFRVANGKIVEHWDRLQDEVGASESKNGRDMFPVADYYSDEC